MCRTIILFAALLLTALPAAATGELPAFEEAWLREHHELRKTFAEGLSGLHVETHEQSVNLELDGAPRYEWVLNEKGDGWDQKITWIGDARIDGHKAGRHGAVATTLRGITWLSVRGFSGVTVFFPDGRSVYTATASLRCGTDTSVYDKLMLAQGINLVGELSPPAKAAAVHEFRDVVSWTPQAESYWGGAAATRVRVLHLEDIQNLTYCDSGRCNLRVKFVGFRLDRVYRESGKGSGLEAFNDTNKYYKKIRRAHGPHKKVGAPFMTMFATSVPGGYAGIAQRGGMYKIVEVEGADTTHPHEHGHNHGLTHGTAYAHITENLDNSFVTVMFNRADPPPGLAVPPGVAGEVILRYSTDDPAFPWTSPFTGETFPTGDAAHCDVCVIDTNLPRVASRK